MKTDVGLRIEQAGVVLSAAGVDLTLIGGQAVSFWEHKYRQELNPSEPATSKDIDFWGDRQLLIALAKKLGKKAHFPHPHLMTLLSGMFHIRLADRIVNVDVLHHVPGVDDSDWEKISLIIPSEFGDIRVLDPIALMGTKLHNLKHFDQSDRQDRPQLLLCFQITRVFLHEILRRDVRRTLGYIKRFLEIACIGNNQRLIQGQQLPIFDSIPIEAIEQRASSTETSEEDRTRINNFLSIRWAQLKANGFVG